MKINKTKKKRTGKSEMKGGGGKKRQSTPKSRTLSIALN